MPINEKRIGPPVHDDLVKRDLCAVKDVFSGRIVGYSMDSRMKAPLTWSSIR